jgi:hypothetical protein
MPPHPPCPVCGLSGRRIEPATPTGPDRYLCITPMCVLQHLGESYVARPPEPPADRRDLRPDRSG